MFRNVHSDSALIIFERNAYVTGNIPTYFLHLLLEPYSLNIIYLRDRSRMFALKGIDSLGANFNETIDCLHNTLNDWKVKNTYCLGTSGMGYTAALYGIKLKANAITVFSGAASMKKRISLKWTTEARTIFVHL